MTLGPGRVRQPVGNNRIALGELDGSTTDRLTALAGLLRSAGFQVDTERPIREEIWRKLAHVMVVSPISVLTGAPPGLAFRDPAIRAAAARVYREIFATAAAYGYPQADDVSRLVAAQISLNKPSMLQDLEAGRPIEIDAQLVAPFELAHEAGVEAPMMEALLGLVRARAAGAGLYGSGGGEDGACEEGSRPDAVGSG